MEKKNKNPEIISNILLQAAILVYISWILNEQNSFGSHLIHFNYQEVFSK